MCLDMQNEQAALSHAYNVACQQLMNNDIVQAADTFMKLTTDSSETALALAVRHNHALCLEMQGLFSEALQAYKGILTAAPAYTKSLLGSANCLSYLGEMVEAVKVLHHVLLLQPDCVQAHILMSQLLSMATDCEYDQDVLRYHQNAIDAVDTTKSKQTRYYAQCYYEHCTETQFHMFQAESLLDRGLQTPQALSTCILPDTDTVMLLMTNSAYVHYTRNLLNSITTHCPELLKSVLVCCLDDQSCSQLGGFPVLMTVHRHEDTETTPALYGTTRFSNVVNMKVVFIQVLLQRGKQVLYCDSDIVVLKNPLPYMEPMLQDKDVIVQREKHDQTVLCTGFVLVKPTPATLKTFDWHRIPTTATSEQPMLNYLFQKFDVPHLPLSTRLFPSGAEWYADSTGDPYVVHYNWISNLDKKARMQSYGHWFDDV